jgi:hypothetical protein
MFQLEVVSGCDLQHTQCKSPHTFVHTFVVSVKLCIGGFQGSLVVVQAVCSLKCSLGFYTSLDLHAYLPTGCRLLSTIAHWSCCCLKGSQIVMFAKLWLPPAERNSAR